MDEALATLNSLADPGPNESAKRRDAEIRGYIANTNTIPQASKAALLEDPRRAFEVIDPSKNSIGYLYLIDMIICSGIGWSNLDKLTVTDKLTLAERIVPFLTSFDPVQVRYVGTTFRYLLEAVASGAFFPPAVSVELLVAAILRLDPTGSLFTSTHLLLAKLAVESNILEPALEVLDKEITGYPIVSSHREAREARDSRPLSDPGLGPAAYISITTGLTDSFRGAHVLEYNFFRSIAYSSRRDWDKAFTALEQVVTHPVKDRGMSRIMVECYKRWVLVGLLKTGRVPTLPSYTASAAVATYNPLGAEYKELASLFTSPKAHDFKEYTDKNVKLWQDDGTTSLVAEVLSAYQKWQIINLRKIFTEVSIAQVRKLTCSAETGEPLATNARVISLIQGMLASGMLQGTLDVNHSEDGGFLHFGGPGPVLTEQDFARDIATTFARITALNNQYKEVNDRLSEKKEYVKHVVLEQRRSDKEGPDAGVGFDSQIEDEDLMTGIMAHG
ncbi:COP9 subunit 3 [Cordyceps militaris]|uniref:COP9 subunit 3 n=1 Tax=Cordyceps militaris TaxID=73501 RepID=A0A2H4SQS2_CORMI|nr:COP9 subunit 3 [Cordyceps militaris]